MRVVFPALLCLMAAPSAAQEELSLPSGLTVTLQEILWDDDLSAGRFRFVAAAIGEPGFDVGLMPDDMAVLCRDFALPVQRALRPGWDDLVISFASAPADFGQVVPDVVQFFEGFRAEGQDCIWSEF